MLHNDCSWDCTAIAFGLPTKLRPGGWPRKTVAACKNERIAFGLLSDCRIAVGLQLDCLWIALGLPLASPWDRRKMGIAKGLPRVCQWTALGLCRNWQKYAGLRP